ncbi:mitochondrial ATP synthase g subunit-domain-containing protein [Lipomyces kononenkoae]|uniref:Mitochondrial ATP synthase g subunit-domain-containing protein n=1 Tax=Lipomyces kononenkoae TaxID=34357 RepID=A0ACC3STJ7_LIPKO
MLRQSVSSPVRSLFSAGPVSRGLFRSQQMRQNSTLNGLVARANAAVANVKKLADSGIYWSKVVAEVSKQVYLKESFAPPTLAQFRSTFNGFHGTVLPYFATPEAFISGVKSVTGATVFKFVGYSIQLFGAFSLGEIIGRRKIVGY